MQEQVKDFTLAAGYPASVTPLTELDGSELVNLPGKKESESLRAYLITRISWIQEEVDELTKATIDNDLLEQIDALADILYFTFGTAICLGIDLEPFFDEVQRSNMAKFPKCGNCNGSGVMPQSGRQCRVCHGNGSFGTFRKSDGKLMKPKGWKPPDLKRVLENG